MGWFARACVLVLLGTALLAPAANAQSAPTDELTTLLNRARVQHGVKPLARSSALDFAAQGHSQDMVSQAYLDRPGSDGSTPQERAERAGYHVPPQSGWIVVEVISAISDEPAGPLDWWLNESPEIHGKVLLDPRWREVGVGYATGGEYGHYWTVLVGCRPDVLPTVTLDGTSYATSEQCGDPDAAAAAANAASLRLTSGAVAAGSDLEVRWSDIAAPSARDWLGLHRTGDGDMSYVTWVYVSCATLPLTARPSGWCWLHVPLDLAAGDYEVRIHANDVGARLADSAAVQVLPRQVAR